MTSLDRNGDVVRLISYAPLLARRGHTQWVPDLIYFDNTTITPTINYYVQQLFSTNAGDVFLPATVRFEHAGFNNAAALFAVSCVQDTNGGDIIVKLVSRADAPIQAQIDISAVGTVQPVATCLVISGSPLAENIFAEPASVMPKQSEIAAARQFSYEVPAYSLSIIRISTRQSASSRA